MATYTIKNGHILTITTDALTTATYFRILDPSNTSASGVSSVAVSSTAIIGPFTNDQRFEVDSKGSGITVVDSFTNLSNVSNLTALTGVQAVNIADIGNSATGTQIATAVNGLKSALVAAGIMAAAS